MVKEGTIQNLALQVLRISYKIIIIIQIYQIKMCQVFCDPLTFLICSYGPTRPIFPSWDESNQPIVITSELHLPGSSGSASTSSWLSVTWRKELATDKHQ